MRINKNKIIIMLIFKNLCYYNKSMKPATKTTKT